MTCWVDESEKLLFPPSRLKSSRWHAHVYARGCEKKGGVGCKSLGDFARIDAPHSRLINWFSTTLPPSIFSPGSYVLGCGDMLANEAIFIIYVHNCNEPFEVRGCMPEPTDNNIILSFSSKTPQKH